MLRLTILGRTSLTGPSATGVNAVLAQPKRLALLAYLALSPDQCANRDRFTGIFWGESDDVRARAAARKALHFLREHLGADLFAKDVGAEVRLAPGAAWCDAVAFRQEINSGNYVTALSLYQGDLLPESWLDEDASEFERWLQMQREDLRNSASGAALKLSEAEFRNDNVAAAMFWATRAELLSPYNEQITARVIGLMDAAGDRSAALRKYAELSARLKSDFDSEPAPETRELIAAIRMRKDSTLTPRESSRMRTPIAGVAMLLDASGRREPARTDPLRNLVEDAIDVIFTADPRGYFTYTNRASEKLLGIRKSEIIGRLFVDFIRQDYRLDAVAFYLRQVQQQIPESYLEFPVETPDGRTVWLGQHVRLRMEGGKPTGIEAVARDITALRQLRRAADRLSLVPGKQLNRA